MNCREDRNNMSFLKTIQQKISSHIGSKPLWLRAYKLNTLENQVSVSSRNFGGCFNLFHITLENQVSVSSRNSILQQVQRLLTLENQVSVSSRNCCFT